MTNGESSKTQIEEDAALNLLINPKKILNHHKAMMAPKMRPSGKESKIHTASKIYSEVKALSKNAHGLNGKARLDTFRKKQSAKIKRIENKDESDVKDITEDEEEFEEPHATHTRHQPHQNIHVLDQ